MESFVRIKKKHVVSSQLPSYVSQEHGTFVKFLETYYEFLEEHHGADSYLLDTNRYHDIDSMPESFVDTFLEEIKEIPGSIAVDKRLLGKHIRDLYAAKGTKKSYELLFRILYGEDIEIYEPGKHLLRSSDGKWSEKEYIRLRIPNSFDLTSFDNSFLFQYDNFDNETYRCFVSSYSIIRKEDEYTIVDVKPEDQIGDLVSGFIFDSQKSIRFDIIETVSIDSFNNRGALAKEGDSVFIDGYVYYVDSIGTGSIDSITIVEPGAGFSVNDFLFVDNSGTDGGGASVVVTGVNAYGGITNVRIKNKGIGYKFPPKISGTNNNTCKIIAHGNNIGRILSIKQTEPIELNFGADAIKRLSYSGPLGLLPGEKLLHINDRLSLEFGFNFRLEDSSSVILSEDSNSNEYAFGEFVSYDGDHILVKNNFGAVEILSEAGHSIISESGEILSNEKSTYPISNRMSFKGQSSGLYGKILFSNIADVNTKMSPSFKTGKSFINDDGKISNSSKKLIDSRYYQDFSYVIKSSQSFELYKNIVYKLLHPAGLSVFGEVNIDTYLDAVKNRLSRAVDELKILREILLENKASLQENTFSYKIEQMLNVGSGPEWLERNKFNFAPIQTETIGAVNTVQSPRNIDTRNSSWDISPFMCIKFSDLYDYSANPIFINWFEAPGENNTQIAVADGSFVADGLLVANAIPVYPQGSSKYYALKHSMRLPWTYGADIKQVNI